MTVGSQIQIALNDDIMSAPGGGAPAVAEDHFKVLLQKQRQAQVRHRAYGIFHGQKLSSIRYALDKEVAEEKLKVRTDRELYADLGLRSEIINMMMSYNPVWLRLGLEITYGEVIPMTKKALQDAGRSALKVFLKERLLQDPETTERFKTTKLGAFGKAYAIAVAQKTLQRFLTIVLFLDKAKQNHVLENGPCLFNKNAKIKSSKTMVIDFAKKFLSGEGDIIRHLGLLGYEVQHKQSILDEFDYTVKNLASDLRDGVRLCRLVEMMIGKHRERPLSKKLRIPAGSLLQKKHNVKLAFMALKNSGMNLKVTKGRSTQDLSINDVVQAHKEHTLVLLWKIIAKFKLEKMLPLTILRREINIIKGTMSQRDLKFVNDQEADDTGMKPQKSSTSLHSEYVSLLKTWARCICAKHLVSIYDFSLSFADGRVLCALVNFYHPELVSKASINDATLSNRDGSKSFVCMPFK